jgi:hypothetical protein
MKKLTYLVSALATALAGSAYADVSVSGSGSANYISKTVSGDKGNVHVGSAVVFGLSTTTANGIGISTGLSITVTASKEAASTTGGGQKLTFSTGGSTITVGDIELGDTPGSVGSTVGVLGDASGIDSDVKTGFEDDGAGISLSTAVGGATVGVGYIFDTSANNATSVDSSSSMSDFSVSMPLGNMTVTAAVSDSETGASASGASVSMALGGGTLTVGYSNQDLIADAAEGTTTGYSVAGHETTNTVTTTPTLVTNNADDLSVNGETTVMGAKYAMALDADTSVTVGYKNMKDADDDTATQFDASISRSLGGGASVYIDIRSFTGENDDSTSGTAIGIGTSVSF